MSTKMRWLATGVALVLFGCGHDSDDHAGHADHEANGQTLELTLNKGEKWVVDDHTRQTATRISSIVGAAESLQSAEEARELAGRLDEELKTLVQGCTMTGVAHDQLHVFLVAFFPKVAELKEAEDVEQLQKTRNEIDQLLVAYADHFE